jgi:hypothetical protein
MGRYEPKDLGVILDRLQHEDDDRAAIAVAGSLVEHALQLAIGCRLRPAATKSEEDVLFVDSGVFGTFSENIWVAYFLKVIGQKARQELDLIRKIRNQAAHDMNPISFNEPGPIADRCKELQFGADAMSTGIAPTDLRFKFLAVASFFATNLMMRAGDATAEIHDAFANTAPSLNR